MRTIQKIIKRAELPIQYSYGFNPHMNISLAQPLSVGMYSSGEYMDVGFSEKLEPINIVQQLNKNVPSGIKILDAVFIPEKENAKNPPQSMAAIDAAAYRIIIKYSKVDILQSEMGLLLDKGSWDILRKSKNSEKEIDMKPMIKSLSYEIKGNILEIDATISCGSRENLSASLLAEFIKKNTSNVDEEAFIDIKRLEMFGIKSKKLIPLDEYYRECIN